LGRDDFHMGNYYVGYKRIIKKYTDEQTVSFEPFDEFRK